MPRDIQLLFAVLPLSKGRNVEVVDNVCANSCELTAYIALCVSLSLFFSLSSIRARLKIEFLEEEEEEGNWRERKYFGEEVNL